MSFTREWKVIERQQRKRTATVTQDGSAKLRCGIPDWSSSRGFPAPSMSKIGTESFHLGDLSSSSYYRCPSLENYYRAKSERSYPYCGCITLFQPLKYNCEITKSPNILLVTF